MLAIVSCQQAACIVCAVLGLVVLHLLPHLSCDTPGDGAGLHVVIPDSSGRMSTYLLFKLMSM